MVDSLSMPAGVLSITGSLRDAFRRLEEKPIEGGEKAPFSGGENSDGASSMPQVLWLWIFQNNIYSVFYSPRVSVTEYLVELRCGFDLLCEIEALVSGPTIRSPRSFGLDC